MSGGKRPRGLFVTGTDTGVGKTVLAASIAAALVARGVAVRALKPVITGLEDPPDQTWPPDDVLLARVTGDRRQRVAPVRHGPPVSPHLAAELSGSPVPVQELVSLAREAAAQSETLIVEGAGGLLVPLRGSYDMRALARDIGLPLVVAARPGLGTINHTLLTLEAARAAGLKPAGVVLGPWPAEPSTMELSNRDTIAALGMVEVSTLPWLRGPDPELLAAAGATLPLERWLGAPAAARYLERGCDARSPLPV